MKKDYFASLPSDRIGDEIIKRIEDYRQYLMVSGQLSLWKRSFDAYYKPAIQGSKLRKSGEQSEYTNIAVNHYRNLLGHLKTMTTQNRPAFEPRATNTDHKSQAQCILANGLLDYYLREKKLERHIKTAVEHALVFGEGFVRTEWDATSGEVYAVDPDTEIAQREGDIKYQNFLPSDVTRDFSKDNSQDHDWYILTTYENKYTLAAKYPDLADKILNLPSRSEIEKQYTMANSYSAESDDIPVYEFYHRETAAVDNGRLVVCLDSDIVLLDGPLPYRTLPVYRITPDDRIGSCFGYTVGYDLMPIQEAIDSLYSTVITNQATFGVQNIAIPQGHNLSVTEISGGLNLIEYDVKLGKPEALNLTNTPAEIFKFIEQLERLMETISGVNSVARGNPESSLKSGSALALVQSMSIQFSIGLQQSYAQLLEDLGTATINILRDFAQVPRIAMIAGKSQRSLMQEFVGDDLGMINRVVVDSGNALSRTTSGKVQLAENLLQNGMVKTAEEYIQVMNTGKLEPIIEGITAELLNIRSENEELANGNECQAVITDDHKIHIQEHKAVLASPEARKDPRLLATALAHIQEHLDMLSNPANANLFMLLGQQPLQPTAPTGNPVSSAEQLNATNPVTQQAASVNQPNMPVSPLV